MSRQESKAGLEPGALQVMVRVRAGFLHTADDYWVRMADIVLVAPAPRGKSSYRTVVGSRGHDQLFETNLTIEQVLSAIDDDERG